MVNHVSFTMVVPNNRIAMFLSLEKTLPYLINHVQSIDDQQLNYNPPITRYLHMNEANTFLFEEKKKRSNKGDRNKSVSHKFVRLCTTTNITSNNQHPILQYNFHNIYINLANQTNWITSMPITHSIF